jgi:opacity protein-like surface antigen
MRAYRFALFALVAFTVEALPAAAQGPRGVGDALQDAKPAEASSRQAKAVEVTPYVALGSSAASPVGVALTFPVTSTLDVETDVAYRRGEGGINALSSSASLLYSLPRVGHATPYVAAGIGLSQYGASVFSTNGPPIGTQPRVALTMNAGGGLKMPMTDRLDFRTDARWFKSFGRQGSEQFRVAQGISFDTGKR